MAKHCEDCGTILERNGVCSNCHEESWIEDWQEDEYDSPHSEEWNKKAAEQRQKIATNG